MVGTKQEIIAMLQNMQEIGDDDTIMIDMWTISEVMKLGNGAYDEATAIEAMKCVDKDLRNESTYATVSFAINQ